MKHKSKLSKKAVEALLRRRRVRKGKSRYDKSPIGKASDYIWHFKELSYKDKMKVILYCRVSIREQKGNLKNQKLWLCRFVKQYPGCEIIKEIKEVSSGSIRECDGLKIAVKEAEKKGAIILAESTDRFVRNVDFHSHKNPDVLPTVEEFEYVQYITAGTILATALHPDLPWREVRKQQSIRGLRKARSQGRIRKKHRKHRKGWRAKRKKKHYKNVIRMRTEGMSLGNIAKELGLTKSLVQYWITGK